MVVYKLKKSKKILLHFYALFLRKKKKIGKENSHLVKECLSALQKDLLAKDAKSAHTHAVKLESLAKVHLQKNLFEKGRDFLLGLAVALVFALLIRQMWFELYEIPTGSMRPTFKEKDHVSVSKTDFGINFPFSLRHLYFDPQLVKRNGIVIFTVEDMDFKDADTVYFYIFPGKKLLVKRLIGKPGDTLYFYGGKIYGMDAQGNDISQELQLSSLSKIDHIPFISFEGKVQTASRPTNGIYSPVILYQMNEPLAKLWIGHSNQGKGELLPKLTSQNPALHYDNLWGMENFAMARLLTKDQVKELTDHDLSSLEEGVLYLELKHHPSLANVIVQRDEWNRLRPTLGLSSSIIPLKQKHLRTLFKNLYTCRFVVYRGFAHSYSLNPSKLETNSFFPYLPDVPNGTYEFYYGKAYQVNGIGMTSELPETHPLYHFSPERIQLFFNLGTEFDTRLLFPSRYSYFQEGNLFTMGGTLLTKEDPTLLAFIDKEMKKREASHRHYEPFVDSGPPLLSNGDLNKVLISKYGLKVPPRSYLVLGDNHANSGDSRVFGFVPEGNLRGGPVAIFWPPSSRLGAPNQPPYPLFNTGRVIIWTIAFFSFGTWYMIHKRRTKLPLKELDV